MSFSNFLEALQGNYVEQSVVADDTNTVRGLLAYCKKWATGQVASLELGRPCRDMAARLRAEAAANEADLRATPNLAAVMRAPIEQMTESYLAIAEVLEEVPVLAAEDMRAEYLEALEIFDEERRAIVDANASLELQVSGKVAICPCCGASGGSVCTSCHLVLLYPDPRAASRMAAPGRRATLSGVYGDVFKAYVAVSEGKAGLEALETALVPLEAHLRELLQAQRHFTAGEIETAEAAGALAAGDFANMLNVIRPEIEAAQRGIARLRAVSETRQMADLHRGWDEIFDAAQVIDGGLRRVRQAHGAEVVETAPESMDTIELSAA